MHSYLWTRTIFIISKQNARNKITNAQNRANSEHFSYAIKSFVCEFIKISKVSILEDKNSFKKASFHGLIGRN